MKNLKFYNTKLRLTSLILSVTMIGSVAVGCKKKDNTDSVASNPYETYQTMVDETNKELDALVPELSDEMTDNATIMLLLDLFAKEDENGKISADAISQFKTRIDADDMINEFNAFLDAIGNKAILEGELEKISTILPDELKNDSIILSNIELVVENIIKYSKEGNKEGVVSEYNKIYTLFVEEKEIEVNGVKFEIRDLTNPSRAVATTYAEIANTYAREYIEETKRAKLDARTNDQNNKAYMKSDLEILANQMTEKSEIDVISVFNNKYAEITNLLNGKVKLSEDTIKNLVNYINVEYITSEKVSTKDRNQLLGEYGDEKVNAVLAAIDAINLYNQKNPSTGIAFSSLLINEYLKTEKGNIDKTALDFVQFNMVGLNKTSTSIKDYKTLSVNGYFQNMFKYFTKQNFEHQYPNQEKTNISWQEISDGVNFVNYQTISYSLNQLPKVDNLDNYKEVNNDNLGQSIQFIQNTIMDECKKVDSKEYVLTK